MKNSLLYADSSTTYEPLRNRDTLIKDLNLEHVFSAASGGDRFIYAAVRDVLLCRHAPTESEILLRQAALGDTIANFGLLSGIYSLVSDGIAEYETQRLDSSPAYSRESPVTSRLSGALALFRILLDTATEAAHGLSGFLPLADSTVYRNVVDEFCKMHLDISNELSTSELISSFCESGCMTLTASPGGGLKPGNMEIVLSDPASVPAKKGRALTGIAIQDQANSLRDGALKKLLTVVGEVSSKILKDLRVLRYELGFFTGCARLYKTLETLDIPTVFPVLSAEVKILAFDGLVDVTLGLQNRTCPVGNSLDLCGRRLIMLSGANQGGKSTFLRSVGSALMMARCGLFVAAESFVFSRFSSVETLFCRAENGSEKSGRLESELKLLRGITEHMDKNAILLMNEAFSSTSESHASRLADDVLTALYDSGVTVFFVTHFFRLADNFVQKGLDRALFATAGRSGDGGRTYKIEQARPESTSYGMDIFREVFGHGHSL